MRCEVAKAVMKHKAKKKRYNIYHWKRGKHFKLYKTINILPAYNGGATVIMKATDYEENIAELLGDDTTYKKLERDPTKVK